ncbi:deoxyribonuclease-1 [Azotobacter beijerinckii]|uniref:Deoxyribonuclease-1 n=1 Tax=Azotobacter beijerinckii TaxID=170623 RepID=A0A1H6U1Q1_9GAMM|nr:endonuclease I family protein [Azotobacter beijerinckii]SEI85416.1 deoxyribonuclease-1 [Azotobacter beijerinckii]SEQ29883.1 deoxyribonuclease-1 [Azotobacter beijerinckii]
MSTPAAKKILSLLSGIALAVAGALFSDIRPPGTFGAAKKLAQEIHADDPLTFYCGCRYRDNRIDLASCGYRPRQNPQRAGRLEWEHVVPAWVIGHQRQCWKTGGRDNCSANDPVFARAEADLHNLVPEIGEVNGDRSNFGFAMLDKAPDQYGQCRMVVDFQARKAMPREEVRGAVARTYLYMHDRYKLRMAKQDRQLYEAWNRQYPVTEQERRRNQKVACQMGWGNPYVGEVALWRCGFGGAMTGLLDTARGLLRQGLDDTLSELLTR